MKKLLLTMTLLIISVTQAMDQVQWHENPETSEFLSMVTIGDINLLSCSTRTQEELDEALYNATYFNQLDALYTLFESGANAQSIAAKHAYIKAMLTGNTLAMKILKDHQVKKRSYNEAFIIAVNDQSADLIQDFIALKSGNILLPEHVIKLGLRNTLKTGDQLIFTLLIQNINSKLKNYALYLATKHAINALDNSFVEIVIAEGIDQEDTYCQTSLMLALASDNIPLRCLLFEAGIIAQKAMNLRSTKQRHSSRKLQRSIKHK